MKSSCIVVVFVFLLLAPAGAEEVSFTVEEPIGAARSHEVVSGGIPLPKGKYQDTSAFSLFDGAAEVPVQISPIVKYPDGSLHWALVSFPVSIPANSKKTYTLKDRPGRAVPKNPVAVKETGDVVEVSNGRVAFAVRKLGFNGFEWIKVNDKMVFRAAKAGLTADGKGGPGATICFLQYYRGPVRTTLYVKGRYGQQQEPTFAMAITLNAGEEVIHIAHSLRNAGVGAVKMSLASFDLRLGLACELKAQTGGTGGGKQPGFGWQSFGGATDVLVFLRHGGPGNKGRHQVEVRDGELAIDLNPADGQYVLAEGAHKSTEIDLAFGGAASKEALCEPLHALADCAWLSANDGFGVGKGWGSLADETQTYKNAGLKDAEDPKKVRREKTDPNLYFGSFDAHATSECDHLQGMVFGYVRTGQRGYLDQAHAWARYWRTYLVWRSDEFIYGRDSKFNTPKWGVGRCCSEGCHFYGVGIFNYALLTGDIDALEAAFDWAEMANLSWYGRYSGKKPGWDFAAYGSRGFARSYLAVARAYDVARDEFWRDSLLHYVSMACKSPARDPRGFVSAGSMANPNVARKAGQDSPEIQKLFDDEKVEIVGKLCKHPKYGQYQPKCLSSWPEAMEAMANYISYEALKDSPDPASQLAAEDAMDYCIAEAYAGVKYAYNPLQKAVYYYMSIDYPIPDCVPNWYGGKWKTYQPRGTDSWYTKWWPNVFAYGYALTGERGFKEKLPEVLWWALAREYVNPPSVPPGEAPPYARVEHNTKGDCMTPAAFAFGIGAHPKQDEAAPAPVSDLKAAALGGGKVELSWTAPGDYGGGKVVRYQVKYAEQPIKDYLDVNYREEFRSVCYWNMAVNVLGEPAPQAPGRRERMTLSVPAGKPLYFAVRSFDDSHNLSAVGTVVKVDVER